jgi:hypothetical protein
MLRGVCQSLLAGGHDFSKGCTGRLVNETFKVGRTGFTFTIGDLGVITFSGSGSQVKPTADSAVQPIDKVIFTLTGMGTPPNVAQAVGRCSFANPFLGRPMTVVCSAETKNGRYSARFLTDGRTPDAKSFG